MSEFRTNIDSHGKILIPAKLRKELQFNIGDVLVIRRIDNELRLVSLKNIVKKIQEDFKLRSNSEGSAVDEFLAIRKKEAIQEDIN
jgi:bifunctional DNA-binding transcriptional regulator/antitoxin component of YhaV-PrlF toxin-antitoxin module